MDKAKDLKGTNVYINKGYWDVVCQKRKEHTAMMAVQEQGNIAFV